MRVYTVQGQGQGPTPYTYISIKYDSNQNHSGESSFFRKIKIPARVIFIWVKFDWDIRVWGRLLALPLNSVHVCHVLEPYTRTTESHQTLWILVFESPVRSGLFAFEGLDRDQDRSTLISNLQKTGPNRQRLVYSGRSRSFCGYKTGFNWLRLRLVINWSWPVFAVGITIYIFTRHRVATLNIQI